MSDDPNKNFMGYVSIVNLRELNEVIIEGTVKRFKPGEKVRYIGERYWDLKGLVLTINETQQGNSRWVNCWYQADHNDFGVVTKINRLSTWIKTIELERIDCD